MTNDRESEQIQNIYKERGYQKQTFKEYMDAKKQAQKPKAPLPLPVKIILYTPLIIIACAGLVFIPFVIYLIFASPEVKTDKPVNTTASSVYKK